MMKINGFNGTNTQTGAMGMAQANDSVSKNIQNQIANAQQKLQITLGVKAAKHEWIILTEPNCRPSNWLVSESFFSLSASLSSTIGFGTFWYLS